MSMLNNNDSLLSFEQLEQLASNKLKSGSIVDGMELVEDKHLILRIPPFLINNYNECVRQFYRRVLNRYNSKYGGIILAVDPNFKVYETFGHSFQDNHCMYMRAWVRMMVFCPHINSVYTVKVSRVIYVQVVTIPVDCNSVTIQNISVGDELNVSISHVSVELENLKLEANIVGSHSHAAVKTENMENHRCGNEYNLLVDNEYRNLNSGRKRKQSD